ncbi:MAG TPA: SDR family oxidoreductase [Solirubrobacteraceae bacterium]|jgi:NAD(P)-dependent dehydrogenase (short-subunit alcohol dehydrogenase family)|nr:SDR family oxidoreductase [Solirubrobacteraceae bacterium]
MGNALAGRVVAITGAGNGIGREHALLFAAEGAKVVVNDLGGAGDGTGSDATAAQTVVDEITSAGGEAVAHTEDISSWEGGASLVRAAVDAFGQLDALVNNAGILRDAFIGGMSEDQWDAVIKVHLKGHFVPLRHATDHWKARSKAGEEVRGAVVNTASASGTFMPNPGQVNYGAAKAGIAAMTLVAAQELGRYGVRVNGIAPAARTRLTVDVPMIGELVKAPEDPDAFDAFHPKHVSPLVGWLISEDCPLTGQLFAVQGGSIQKMSGWTVGDGINADGDWTIDNIAAQLGAARV